jgi:hypothetical protein
LFIAIAYWVVKLSRKNDVIPEHIHTKLVAELRQYIEIRYPEDLANIRAKKGQLIIQDLVSEQQPRGDTGYTATANLTWPREGREPGSCRSLCRYSNGAWREYQDWKD